MCVAEGGRDDGWCGNERVGEGESKGRGAVSCASLPTSYWMEGGGFAMRRRCRRSSTDMGEREMLKVAQLEYQSSSHAAAEPAAVAAVWASVHQPRLSQFVSAESRVRRQEACTHGGLRMLHPVWAMSATLSWQVATARVMDIAMWAPGQDMARTPLGPKMAGHPRIAPAAPGR